MVWEFDLMYMLLVHIYNVVLCILVMLFAVIRRVMILFGLMVTNAPISQKNIETRLVQAFLFNQLTFS